MKITGKLLIGILLAIGAAGCLNDGREVQPTTSNTANTERKAENINRLDNQSATVIPPSPDTLTTGLLRKRKNKIEPVLSSETFKKDDGVRLKISTVESGLVTVLYRGSEGEYLKLFPHESYNKGKNSIAVNQVLEIPDSGWLFFDEKKGVETIYVVYSKSAVPKELGADPKTGVALLEKLRLENKNAEAFTTDSGDLVRIIELKHE